MTWNREAVLGRMRASLDQLHVGACVLSGTETVAHLSGYAEPLEDYPVANPFVASPALLVLSRGDARVIAPDSYPLEAAAACVPTSTYRSYAYQDKPDPRRERQRVLAVIMRELEISAGRIGVEEASLPMQLADDLRQRGFELVDVGGAVLAGRVVKLPDEVDAIREASRLCDAAQRAIVDEARSGLTDVELAGLAHLSIGRVAGRRVPAFLNVTSGAKAAAPPWEADTKTIEEGDIVLTDVAPWFDGVWSDSANAVVVGSADKRQQEVFDAVRRTLELAISLCRPGAVARDVDRRVRASLENFGRTYPHHTGHGIGASWSEEPRITPYSDATIGEGMVLSVEPAVYIPGWGGIRLEHTFLVGPRHNEMLTEFEHTLS